MPFVAEKLVAEAQPVRHGEVKRLVAPAEAVPALPQHEGKGRGEKAQCGKALPRDIEFFLFSSHGRASRAGMFRLFYV